MVLRFDWLEDVLPEAPWPEALRAALCEAMKPLGWNAVSSGEFGPLARLYDDFTTIFPHMLVDASDVDRAADLYTLMHIMLWRRTQVLSELKRFNPEVVLPFAGYLARHFPKLSPVPSSRETPRIAYLSETSDLFGSNAVARITVSLMLGQHELRDPADWPILYCMNPPAPCLIAFAEDHGLRIANVARATPSATTAAVLEQIAADGIDMLISDTNCAVATMVMQRRPCAVQALHENGFATWAIPELDMAFMGVTPPSDDLFDRRVEMHQTPRHTAFALQRQPRPQSEIDGVRAVLCTQSGVAEPSVVYGVYGRMAKVTAEYMALVERILSNDPRAIFFAGGTGRISPIVDCLRTSPVADRMVIYNDFIDAHVIAECIDVFLDTFPFPAGMSGIEVMARGVPLVWLAPPPEDEMHLLAQHRDAGLKASDADHYVALARYVAQSDAWVAHGEVARGIAHDAGDMRGEAEIVDGHIHDAWARARRGTRLAA